MFKLHQKLQEDTTEIQENGRYAINTLAHDIRLSGYWGLAYHSDVVIDTTAKSQTYSGSVSSACSAADWVTSSQSIFGLNASTATANANTFITCIPASEYKTGTDILVVRHASEQAAPVTTAGFENNIIYVQTALDKGRYFTGSPPAADSEYLVPLTNHEMNVHVYYVRPWAVKNGDGLPTLVRESLVAGPQMQAQPLVEGIENMQISYGIDATATPDNVVDQYLPANAVSDWTRIVSVRVVLLARASTKEGTHTDQSTYDLGEYSVTPNDNYRRRMYSITVQLRNHRKPLT